ncbi:MULTISPECIES: D-sedoheptulose-7-phosphate isomerase [Microbacterium]|uniref:D-sedoheptulose-7-phosphate isomerase n=1 Tax=Microbacterium TaxID=33882 RepID=UPI0024AFB605|nr:MULTISPECIES: SIS domain-containing protein [Microbacterium]MDI6942262.1 SIS domain-containing protein [Microbacterium barkeri]
MTIAETRGAARVGAPARVDPVRDHLRGLGAALASAERHAEQLEAWGVELAARLRRGQRVLVAGNGGSAAEAQHLTAELVGRYREERPAYSAIALNAETSSVTAIGNDYGFDEVFARQVRAHARAGDIVLLLSTSGASPNLLHAARAGRLAGAATWALTGPGPNPLAEVCDEAVCLDGPSPHVQECQLAAIHAVCRVFDAIVMDEEGRSS